jgi:hypothetical protein
VSDIYTQAIKAVNEFIERADGNWNEARGLWMEEVLEFPEDQLYTDYFHIMEHMFRAMSPEGSGKP